MLRYCYLVLLIVAFPASADTVYKCVGADGKSVFSDKACGVGAEAIQYVHPETYWEKVERERAEQEAKRAAEMKELDQRLAANRKDREKSNREHERRCEARLAQQGLQIGMSKKDIQSSDLWSYPSDTSTTTTAAGVSEHWVYECDGYKSVRLLIVNERLSSIHQ